MNSFSIASLLSLSLTSLVLGHAHPGGTPINHWDGGRADGHAPIGVTAEHTHGFGEWMLSYRFMNMHMEDLYNGDSKVSPSAAGYTIVPTEMEMQMHMFGTMFAPTNNLTLLAMTHYVENSMDMLITRGPRAGQTTHMESKGWGDTSIGGLFKLYDNNKKRTHAGLILSLPTGSTSETLNTPMGVRHQPFPMQLGTGTFDLLPSLTYLHQPTDHWSWGSQIKGRIHLGDNSQGYSFGDSIEATSWIATSVTDWASVSFRLAAKSWGSIDGDTDNSINQTITRLSSPAGPDNQGGTRIDAAIGLNLWHPQDGFRVATEFSTPLYQNLNGLQLAQDWTLTIGSQYAW